MSERLINGANLGTRVQHTTGASSAFLSVSTAAFSNANVAVGYRIYNQTDGSSSLVTSVTPITVVGVLAGGAENDWDVNDFANVPGVARYEIPVGGMRYYSLQYKMTTTANNTLILKVFGTNNPSATTADDTGWIDLGSTTTCTGAQTIEDLVFMDLPTVLDRYMIKVISECSTGAFSNQFYFYIKLSD